MFVGHLAVAMASKRASPETPLPWFIAAANACDLLWPFLLLAGVEHVTIRPGAMAFTPLVFGSYPWSHSLVMTIVWGAVLGWIARRAGVSRRAGWIVGALVVSHWLLDVVTHAPDMPLWPGNSPKLGLGLWNSIPATYVIEGALWLAGIWLYLRWRRPVGVTGHVALWSFVLVSTFLWATGPFGTPPPSEHALASFALMGWVIIPWSWWIERTSRSAA